jgi:hypothetical protein
LPQDKTIVIIGDSHTAHAIDDSIFTHAVNISQNGAAYLNSYIKLRKLFDSNTHIDTVMLSFHYDALLKNKDNDWILGDKIILQSLPLYFFLMGKQELLIYKGNVTFFFAILKIPVRNIRAVLKFMIANTISYRDLNIGAYNRSNREKLQINIIRVDNNTRDFDLENKEDEYSLYQLDYLLKIVALCKERNIELILINTPIYNSDKYGYKDKLADYYENNFSGVKYLDYSDFSLPEEGYGDIGHLNYKGAEIFSSYLEDYYKILNEKKH